MLSWMQESFPKVFPMALIHEATTPKINFRDFLVKEKEFKVKNRPMPRQFLRALGEITEANVYGVKVLKL